MLTLRKMKKRKRRVTSVPLAKTFISAKTLTSLWQWKQKMDIAKEANERKKWQETLRMWTQLVDGEDLRDKNNKKCYKFIIYAHTSSETTITIRQTDSEGLNSEIYEIYQQNEPASVILKKFVHRKEEDGIYHKAAEKEVGPELEAELQKWAAKSNLAPRVYANNTIAMITEKCKPFDYTLRRVTVPKNTGNEFKKRLWMLNSATIPGRKTLDVAMNLYEQTGLFNCDPNFGNYMNGPNNLKQIDFGQERFGNQEKFIEWFKQLPKHLNYNRTELKRQLLWDDVNYPPAYWWYMEIDVNRTLDKTSKAELKKWSKEKWLQFVANLESEKNTLGAAIELINFDGTRLKKTTLKF